MAHASLSHSVRSGEKKKPADESLSVGRRKKYSLQTSMLLKYFHNQQSTVTTEVLAGLTVAVALVPEAVAFSLIAGLSPLVGLCSAFIIGLITSVVGGRPGMMAGATGAIAVVIGSRGMSHGADYVDAALVLEGLIQLGVVVLKLGNLIRHAADAVVAGFVNVLAIVIFI